MIPSDAAPQLFLLLVAVAYLALPRLWITWIRRRDRLREEAFIEQCRETARLQRKFDEQGATP